MSNDNDLNFHSTTKQSKIQYLRLLVVYLECVQGKFGHRCLQPCQCQNNALCNHVNGSCDCSQSPGWTGPLCDQGKNAYQG